MAPPILRSAPERVVGMPVALAILRFASVTPSARLSEKLRPGIFVFDMLKFIKMLLVSILILMWMQGGSSLRGGRPTG